MMTTEEKEGNMFEYLTSKEFRALTIKGEIDYIDSCRFWSDVEPDDWRYLCERVGVNYDDYADPDILFSKICQCAKELEQRFSKFCQCAKEREQR